MSEGAPRCLEMSARVTEAFKPANFCKEWAGVERAAYFAQDESMREDPEILDLVADAANEYLRAAQLHDPEKLGQTRLRQIKAEFPQLTQCQKFQEAVAAAKTRYNQPGEISNAANTFLDGLLINDAI